VSFVQARSRAPRRQDDAAVFPLLRFLVAFALAFFCTQFEAGAQTPDSTRTTEHEWPWPAGVLVVESVAFGSAALACSETGARVIGSIQGISGLAMLSIAGFSDTATGRPEFTVPYGVGLVALAYYNFRRADSPRHRQRFWVNAIGINVAVLAGILSSEAFGTRSQESDGARSSPARFVVRIPF
jgi:hypothetical protein